MYILEFNTSIGSLHLHQFLAPFLILFPSSPLTLVSKLVVQAFILMSVFNMLVDMYSMPVDMLGILTGGLLTLWLML